MTNRKGEKASGFMLHPRLEADTAFVTDWVLSRVLLMNDARYPWLILVPMRNGLVELHDLKDDDLLLLVTEVARANRVLKDFSKAAKINTGALGNVVTQLHIHIVARSPNDPAWPNPVWGRGERVAYKPKALDVMVTRLRAALLPVR